MCFVFLVDLPELVKPSIFDQGGPEERMQFASFIAKLFRRNRMIQALGFIERQQHFFTKGDIFFLIEMNREKFFQFKLVVPFRGHGGEVVSIFHER